MVEGFCRALLPDYILPGGGNTNKLKRLPPQTRIGDNGDAIKGGFHLWQRQDRNGTAPAGAVDERQETT